MENKPSRYTEPRNFRARLVLGFAGALKFLKVPASAVSLETCAIAASTLRYPRSARISRSLSVAFHARVSRILRSLGVAKT
jgi:hypothetical protein